MSRKVRLSEQATRDLEDIFEYTLERWGVDQAIRYVNGLRRHLENLGEREKLGLSRPWRLGAEVYRSRYEEHLIFYKRSESISYIGLVAHGMQDSARRVEAFQARTTKTPPTRVRRKDPTG